MSDFFQRFQRVLRGVGGGAFGRDPDEVLREAGVPPPAPGGGRAAAPRPAGGLSPELSRAYANLELTPPASLEEAKAAWRRLMARYHPDKHQGDERKAAVATELAARLTEAYRQVREHLGG